MSYPSPSFTTSPPATSFAKLSFPEPYVLVVTLSRPKSLNCINTAGHLELHAIYEWLDNEPALRVGIVTGEGKAFCAGADLKEWNQSASSAESANNSRIFPSSGFGALSTRTGRKPLICAVNGLCLGGGFEMIINADLVIASSTAIFGLPEVKRGVVAVAGALPRLVRVVGKQRAMEMSMMGRNYSAAEMKEWGVVNQITSGSEGNDGVLKEAIRWAKEIAANSPDSVLVSRQGVMIGWEGISAQEGTTRLRDEWFARMLNGENMREGLRAFVEKRKPAWVPSKL